MTVDPLSRPTPLVRRVLLAGLLAGGFVSFFWFGLDRTLSLEGLAAHRLALLALVTHHAIGAAVLFIGLYALATAFSVPGGAVLTLAGGFLFGTWQGGLYAVLGASVGAIALFLVARTLLRDTLRRRAGPWRSRFEAGLQRDAFNYLLALRLIPLFPFWLVNLAPALLGVPLRTYALATVIGIIPGALVYASVGNGLGTVFDQGATPDMSLLTRPEVWGPIVALALLALAPIPYRRWQNRHALPEVPILPNEQHPAASPAQEGERP